MVLLSLVVIPGAGACSGGASRPAPPAWPPAAVDPDQPFRLTGWPAGAEAVILRYRVNGGAWTEAAFRRPTAPAPPAAQAEPEFPRSWPAVVLDWQWLARFPEGGKRELAAGSVVRPGQFTAVTWQVRRGERVLLFTSPSGPPAPAVETLEQEYWRLVDLYLDDPRAAPPVVNLYAFPSRAEFARFSSAAHEAAGVAEISLRRAYADRIDSPAELQRVLVHEMAHLIAGSFTLSWFSEGVARLGEEPYWPPGAREQVLEQARRRVRARGAPDLGTAAGHELYDLGYAFVSYLRARYGAAAFRRLLAVAREERGDIELALERVLGKGRKALEEEFAAAVLAGADHGAGSPGGGTQAPSNPRM